MLLCSFRGLFETSDMFESTLHVHVPRKQEVHQVQCSGFVPEPCLNPEEGRTVDSEAVQKLFRSSENPYETSGHRENRPNRLPRPEGQL